MPQGIPDLRTGAPLDSRRRPAITANFSREKLQALLREHICMITFVKKNKQVRVMVCTLRSDIIPRPKGTGYPKPKHVLAVYSINDMGWRSFRISSVFKVTIMRPYRPAKLKKD